MKKRDSPEVLSKILQIDADITKRLVRFLLKYDSFKTLQQNSKFLELSCNGIVWLAIWLAFIWIVDSKELYQMQLNMLFGLLLDIVIIALLKASFRRRRPALTNDMLTLGPDKFSFPSGHASRAVLIACFFMYLNPVSIIWWSPISAWVCCVCLSRLFIQRHYVLDVTIGMIIGVLEALLLGLVWISPEVASSIINYVSYDNVPGGSSE